VTALSLEKSSGLTRTKNDDFDEKVSGSFLGKECSKENSISLFFFLTQEKFFEKNLVEFFKSTQIFIRKYLGKQYLKDKFSRLILSINFS